MKWFVIFAALLGLYFFMLVSYTDMAMNQTMQLHQQYEKVADQADQIAASNH